MEWEDLRFFNPYADVVETQNRLPHWQQQGAVYFVTFRLGDAVPTHLRDDWLAERDIWLSHHPEPWTDTIEREYHERFSSSIEQWLDAGHGSCVLARTECAQLVDDSVRFFDGSRYSLVSFIIMPNHVHALFIMNSAWTLEQIVHSWKRFTARRINQVLGRAGNLWQRDYFDRLVRDANHFSNCVRYIRKNPAIANLKARQYRLYENDLARALE
ncbi:MAG TPA: transposase [Chthoniobacterales bacterium]